MLSELEVHEIMKDPSTDWFYLGEISEDLINSFVTLIDTRPDLQSVPRPLRRKLLSAVVECLQNIMHNTPVIIEAKAGSIVFMRKISDKEFGLRCGNIMRTEEVAKLKAKLDEVNAADTERLKDMYVKQMGQSLESGNRRSAGLGLLEIARASNGPISYRFVPVNEQYTFYCLELKISLNG
ncbi:MAG: hypothetical protein Fur0041_17580 [Bacteroidia bacterium]